MILIDTNAFIVLVLGIIDKNLIKTHKRTSIYEETDFFNLLNFVGEDLSKILVLTNIWTEVDNLLNDFKGDYKYKYYLTLKNLLEETTEQYFETNRLIENINLEYVGITDSIIIEVAKECKYLITGDSKLSDLAIANGIAVYDLVELRNHRLV